MLQRITLKYWIVAVVCLMLAYLLSINAAPGLSAQSNSELNSNLELNSPINSAQPLIRFHVLANSDSAEDQALKWAVRDRILSELSPRLAKSGSLEESRLLLQELRPEMERLAGVVVKEYGYDYGVHTEFGHFLFPTKSYGSFVLPAGDYEALRVVIGQGQGANWWCVLFPPICFVDIEHSTAVPVDGKPGVPLKQPVVKIWIWEKAKEILGR